MASFQVKEDQENQNVRYLRSKQATANNGRSVLGLISNNSRLPVRNKNLGKPIDNGAGKSKVTTSSIVYQDSNSNVENTKIAVGAKAKSSAFTICQDEKKTIEDRRKPVNSTVTSCKLLETKITLPEKREVKLAEKKNDRPSDVAADVFQHRQPLKDLKIVDDEEPMSEGSFIESEASPMLIDKSLTIITPSAAQSKTQQQRNTSPSPSLYDMEEYREDIYKYLQKSEVRQRPAAFYMKRQPEVTHFMRTVLVDWLVEVAEEYKLHTETLYLAVSFIDRFLSVMSVVRGKLQLLGTAAMFIASKYEEIYPPEVSEFVYITDDTYTKRQVLRMEHLILKVLKFDVSVPTILSFLTHLKVECKLSEKNLHLAMYLCELSLLEGDPYLQYRSSLVACSALALARHCLEFDDVWTCELSRTSGYRLNDLATCIAHLNETHSKAQSLQQKAVNDKYKANKWHNVSEIEPRPLEFESAAHS